jgi:hypothetical protein
MPKMPLNRDRALACVTLNISLPGWGSLKAGKTLTGIGELIFSIGGFLLLLSWMITWMGRILQSEMDERMWPVPSAWLWRTGVICIVISWIWTAITCFSLMREAKAYEQSLPPRLSELPKPPKL